MLVNPWALTITSRKLFSTVAITAARRKIADEGSQICMRQSQMCSNQVNGRPGPPLPSRENRLSGKRKDLDENSAEHGEMSECSTAPEGA